MALLRHEKDVREPEFHDRRQAGVLEILAWLRSTLRRVGTRRGRQVGCGRDIERSLAGRARSPGDGYSSGALTVIMSHPPRRPRPLMFPPPRARSGEVIAAVLVTAALHAVFAAYLLFHREAGVVSAVPAEVRTVLKLVERELPAKPPHPPAMLARASPAISRPVPSSTRSAGPAITSAVPLATPAGGNGIPRRLVLAVPETASSGTYAPDMMGRSKAPSTYERTRFADAWAPDGGPVQKTWAQRSRAAHLLLSATGALEFPCTEEEKRLRKPRCSGAQYDHDQTPDAN
jgi:hypothetical protein